MLTIRLCLSNPTPIPSDQTYKLQKERRLATVEPLFIALMLFMTSCNSFNWQPLFGSE